MRLSNPEIRRLKAEAQRLEPLVRVGKNGLTPSVLQSIEQVLAARSLIKIGLDHDRDEREVLAGQIAAATGAALIMQVGKVAAFYRPKAEKLAFPTTDVALIKQPPDGSARNPS